MELKFLKGKKTLTKFEWFFFGILLIFSTLLMHKTFRLDPHGNLMIATKAWSDFAATIPLIRSFSFGSNFPPEYPIFSGPPIRYHFVFFLIVGMLEKIGLPLNIALNVPSIIGFTLLLIIIYLVSRKVFKSCFVGFVSVILFLFNGSFSFVEFFKTHPLSGHLLKDITENTTFPSFGPYDGKIVSAFWNLNIYTNQRHLALAYFIFILLLYYFYKINTSKKSDIQPRVILGLSLLIGLFPFIHYAVFGMLLILLASIFLIYPKTRKAVFIIGLLSLLLAIPQILYMGKGVTENRLIKVGYLITDLNLINFIKYWILNLGLTGFFSIAGFILASRGQKKIFFPFLALFMVGNIFQFSPEIAANHKFFNLYIIGANMFSAFFLSVLIKKSYLLAPLVAIAVFFSTLSGTIDLFPIFNDTYITVVDTPDNKTVAFIKKATPKNTVFLNSSFLYDPASMAGRRIYMGWPYFAWSAGYDTVGRDVLMKRMLNPHDLTQLCNLIEKEKIDYIEISKNNNFQDTPVNKSFFERNLKPVFIDVEEDFIIYDVKNSCKSTG